MDTGIFRFQIGEFECISISDGALNYPPETLFANASSEQVEEALRERGLPVDRVATPYTCLFIDTGEHRVQVDTGAGDLGTHADHHRLRDIGPGANKRYATAHAGVKFYLGDGNTGSTGPVRVDF